MKTKGVSGNQTLRLPLQCPGARGVNRWLYSQPRESRKEQWGSTERSQEGRPQKRQQGWRGGRRKSRRLDGSPQFWQHQLQHHWDRLWAKRTEMSRRAAIAWGLSTLLRRPRPGLRWGPLTPTQPCRPKTSFPIHPQYPRHGATTSYISKGRQSSVLHPFQKIAVFFEATRQFLGLEILGKRCVCVGGGVFTIRVK